ncbi:HAD family hydrolase [Evansella sp. AB-rgal1]|uniref:HAD family hydrolase n=1 Tax=Evansella sp. AB-rgal1 TaxID=3242696 RepID=UPI00359E812A
MLFFDIDDTLLDHNSAERNAALDFYHVHKHDLHMKEQEFISLWVNLSHEFFQKFVAKEISFEEQRQLRMKKLFSSVRSISNEEATLLFDEYVEFYKLNWRAFADVIPCLRNAVGNDVPLGVISNGDTTQQIEKLTSMGIQNYFSIVVTSTDIGYSKPNPHIFQEACKRVGKNVSNCMYIGDRLDVDAIGSTEAGMIGVWLNRYLGQSSRPSTTPIIQNLGELQPLMNSLYKK